MLLLISIFHSSESQEKNTKQHKSVLLSFVAAGYIEQGEVKENKGKSGKVSYVVGRRYFLKAK